MLAKVETCAVLGVDGLSVQAEVDLALGLPAFHTVGLAEGAVREAKDRVRAAIKNSGYEFPPRRITVNLAPAWVRKEGAGYDLPIALGILAACELFPAASLERTAVIGELSLDGSILPVRGVLPMAQAARDNGCTRLLVPVDNQDEAAVIPDLAVFALHRLEEAVEFLAGVRVLEQATTDVRVLFQRPDRYGVDFVDVRGQDAVKRALEVAAAGGHNALLNGVPGTGKTMMARRIPTILPELSLNEAIETTKVYSTAGLLPEGQPLLPARPFRAPHHTVSDAGLIGGGQVPRPGEVSLAHNGVLFLDELPEFRKNVLEVLRQPMEDGVVAISRAAISLSFPARFMLVAAMNPCPCGHLGDSVRPCSCTPPQIQRYQSRLSGPLLDRIDLHIEVPAISAEELTAKPQGESSEHIRHRVNQARRVQVERFAAHPTIHCNAQMGAAQIRQYCILDQQGTTLLHRSAASLGLSARACHRILKVARSIADLDACPQIHPHHLAEAIQYRRLQLKATF